MLKKKKKKQECNFLYIRQVKRKLRSVQPEVCMCAAVCQMSDGPENWISMFGATKTSYQRTPITFELVNWFPTAEFKFGTKLDGK